MASIGGLHSLRRDPIGIPPPLSTFKYSSLNYWLFAGKTKCVKATVTAGHGVTSHTLSRSISLGSSRRQQVAPAVTFQQEKVPKALFSKPPFPFQWGKVPGWQGSGLPSAGS